MDKLNIKLIMNIASGLAVLILGILIGLFIGQSPAPRSVPTPEPTAVVTPSPTPSPTPTPEPTEDPEITELRKRQEAEKEFLTLVNADHPVDYDGYRPVLVSTYQNEQDIDLRCSKELLQMLTDCYSAGNVPFVCSGFRTWDYQANLFYNKIYRLIDEGVSIDDAPAKAARSVAPPGTSEHELGLAVDLVDFWMPDLTAEQENTSTQKWLMEHCWEYGFILRYPNGTTDITGIIYEPWHYRYVGKIAAKAITEMGITLEEYLELLYPEEYAENPARVKGTPFVMDILPPRPEYIPPETIPSDPPEYPELPDDEPDVSITDPTPTPDATPEPTEPPVTPEEPPADTEEPPFTPAEPDTEPEAPPADTGSAEFS